MDITGSSSSNRRTGWPREKGGVLMKSRLNQIQNWPEFARQADWSAKLLAQKCNVSPRTMERFFHKAMGKSPHAWLVELRQRQAIELLRDGSSVKETALTLGYKHPTHFSRQFKRHWGFLPATLARSFV